MKKSIQAVLQLPIRKKQKKPRVRQNLSRLFKKEHEKRELDALRFRILYKKVAGT
jgi:hypothetical protein